MHAVPDHQSRERHGGVRRARRQGGRRPRLGALAESALWMATGVGLAGTLLPQYPNGVARLSFAVIAAVTGVAAVLSTRRRRQVTKQGRKLATLAASLWECQERLAVRTQQLDEEIRRLSERVEGHEGAALRHQRYAQAVAQLGAAEPAVRLGGVYAIASLADDWRDRRQRQMCIDALCAYLRMPYTPPADDITDEQARLAEGIQDVDAWWTLQHRRIQERHVRHTIFRVMAERLRHDVSDPRSWQGHDFDLTGAIIDGADLRGVRFPCGTITFDKATFTGGTTDFREAEFGPESTCSFADTTFADGTITFDRATLSGAIRCHAARFTGGTISFQQAEFTGGALDFTGAVFAGGTIDASQATFTGSTVSLAQAEVTEGTITFSYAQLVDSKIAIAGAEFPGGTVTFERAQFRGSTVDGEVARFTGGTLDFTCAEFNGGAVRLPRARFLGGTVSFSSARFTGSTASFSGAWVAGGDLSFAGAEFAETVVFFHDALLVKGTVDFADATLGGKVVNFSDATWRGGTVTFRRAHLTGGAVNFLNVTIFAGTISFDDALLVECSVSFDYLALEGGSITFTETSFGGRTVTFTGARFADGTVDFSNAAVGAGSVAFSGAEFAGSAIIFSQVWFIGGTVDVSDPSDFGIPPRFDDEILTDPPDGLRLPSP